MITVELVTSKLGLNIYNHSVTFKGPATPKQTHILEGAESYLFPERYRLVRRQAELNEVKLSEDSDLIELITKWRFK